VHGHADWTESMDDATAEGTFFIPARAIRKFGFIRGEWSLVSRFLQQFLTKSEYGNKKKKTIAINLWPPPISWRIFWDSLRLCSTIRIKNDRFGYRIFRDFVTNDWIRRLDIRIFRDSGANEWIRRSDIRIFPDFATGTGTWYWYSTRPQILVP
jgi:hypothetical protein